MGKHSKTRDNIDLCMTPADFIDYAVHNGGTTGKTTGSHMKIHGPKGSTIIKCNHMSLVLQAGLRHVLKEQFRTIGITIREQ